MKHFPLIVVIVVLFSAMPLAAFAYVGPGAGITVIGSALALIFGVIFAIVGFILYPLMRILRKIFKKDKKSTPVLQSSSEEKE